MVPVVTAQGTLGHCFFTPLCLHYTLLLRGTSALHLNEATWIIDGSNELIVDFLFALVLFLDSTQPRPFKNPKQIFFFWIKQTNDM